MNIRAALNAVPSHEASSTPRCEAPRKSANPTLIRRPVQVAIIAPRSTPKTPSKGCVVTTEAGAAASGLGGVLKTVYRPICRSCQLHELSPLPRTLAEACPAMDDPGRA